MTRKPADRHSRIPGSLAPALRRFVTEYGEPERWARTEVGRPWVVITEGRVGYLAHDGPSRLRLQRERSRIEWASEAGVPVPAIVEASEDVLVTERVADDGPGGSAYVALAVAAADAVAAAPPPELEPGSGVRRARRGTLPLRVARSIAGGMDPRIFLAARSAVEGLPHDELCHGDFHPHNVLYDRTAGAVHVIDWSYLGYQPRGSDLAYFWSRLHDEGDRQKLLEATLARSGEPEVLGRVLRWVAIRTLADLLTDRPIRRHDPDALAHARRVLREAEEIASSLQTAS